MSEEGLRSDLADLWQLNTKVDFLNHGSFGACPIEVLKRQTELRFMMESDPVNFIDGIGRGLWADAVVRLSDFLNADPGGMAFVNNATTGVNTCLLYTSPSPRDRTRSRMPSSA